MKYCLHGLSARWNMILIRYLDGFTYMYDNRWIIIQLRILIKIPHESESLNIKCHITHFEE